MALLYLTLLYLTLLRCCSYIGSFSAKLPLTMIINYLRNPYLHTRIFSGPVVACFLGEIFLSFLAVVSFRTPNPNHTPSIPSKSHHTPDMPRQTPYMPCQNPATPTHDSFLAVDFSGPHTEWAHAWKYTDLTGISYYLRSNCVALENCGYN